MEKKKKTKFRYINEFPIIIMGVVAIIGIVLANIYLKFKPYRVIYEDGYMVLNSNMSYNLINNAIINDDMNVGVAKVSYGDYLYRQIDSYFVGVEKKSEIDYTYPIYSRDGLTLYNINEDVILINRNFERFNGYPGFSINLGILYNDGDDEPADDIDYIFMYLNNGIFINTQNITIKTFSNEYQIPVNCPIFFNTKYVNYYEFDGKKFNYQRISDIYYDSLITIGDITLTYEELLLKFELIKEIKSSEEIVDESVTEEEIDTDEEIDNNDYDYSDDNTGNNFSEPEFVYIKPEVSVLDFDSTVYSITSTLTIKDPARVITTAPTFEIYTSDGKLFSRKKISSSGKFKISGLSSNTEYRIVGTYKYKNENDVSIISTFYEGVVTTKTIDELDVIELESSVGDRYPDKLEIKDVTILNKETEAVSGIKKVILQIWKSGDSSKITYSIPYTALSSLLKGSPTTLTSSNSLSSNTIYNYEIKFYDRDDNELKSIGDNSGTVQTSKAPPSLTYSSKVDKQNNITTVTIRTKNQDNIYISDYKYELYTYSGTFLEEGTLDYLNGSANTLAFDYLDYNSNYIIRVSGKYDLEDGRGIQELNETIEFTTVNLSDVVIAWYDLDTLKVTVDSMTTDIYISANTTVLQRESTTITVYLADAEGNDILDANGNLKYSKEYSKAEYASEENAGYHINNTFTGLNSNTQYMLKLKINVKQLESNLTLSKDLSPVIKTLPKEAYITVINKQLLGDTLDLSFQVHDTDGLIDDRQVIIEVYEGLYNSASEINGRYLYRNAFYAEDLDTVSITLGDYNSDKYTIAVSANPYNGNRVKKYLQVINNNYEESLDVINIDRNITVRSEMFEQRYQSGSTKDFNTRINIKYNRGNSMSNLYLVDCADGTCTNLGYIDGDNVFKPFNNNTNYTLEDVSVSGQTYRRRLTIPNTLDAKDRVFYVVVERPGISLSKVEKFYESSINSELYVLSTLEYNTGYEIYNIDDANDFYDTTIIKTSGETKHYVVTENLEFNDEVKGYLIKSARISNFNGSIDFQGYQVNLYRNNNSVLTLFNSVGANGFLKNVILNYYLEYDGAITTLPGFVNTNNGTIQNFVANVTQTMATGRAYAFGLLAYTNNGTIDRFALYLHSDIDTYSASTLVAYTNGVNGTIKNGYVATDPNLLYEKKVILHDSTAYHGTFAIDNSGLIENVYNLVSVVSAEESYTASRGIATIVNRNLNNSTLRNTLSVATTTQTANRYGPNIYNKSGMIRNNYYVDTNLEQLAYNDTYNKKISSVSLRNKGVLDVILNGDKAFSIISGYYPTVKMDSFMEGAQGLIPVAYDYRSSNVDVIMADVITDNINDQRRARAVVHISNPDKMEINNIVIEDITTEIIGQSYDESNQVTDITVDLYLDKETDIAKSDYNIVSLEYTDFLNSKHTRYYNENDKRTIEIDVFRHVSDYDSLVNYISNNENVYLVSNISVELSHTDSTNITTIPKDVTYSAKFNGNNKLINFNNYNISKGYFFYTLTGSVENVKVTGLNITSSSLYIGFIRNTTGATINNVDISDSSFVINRNGSNSNNTLYIGPLTGYAASSTIITNVSSNNCEIKKMEENYKGNVYTNYIGGIVGYLNSSTLTNSYTYNLDVHNMYIDIFIGIRSIGGIVGYTISGTLDNCYSNGSIDTDYSNIGGIAGMERSTYIRNSYSDMNLSSTGDYVGGIAGKVATSTYTNNSMINNMFIGKIENKNSNEYYSPIAPIDDIATIAADNYAFEEDTFTTVTKITPSEFLIFDVNGAFEQKASDSEYYMPYLKETSSVAQDMMNKYYEETIDSIDYSITYENNNCAVNDIRNVNNNSEVVISDLYNTACSSSATLTLPAGYTLNISNSGTNKDGTLFISQNPNGTYMLRPNNKYLNYYGVEVSYGGIVLDIDLNLAFYRKVSSTDDWNAISTTREENVLLLNDIYIEPDGNIEGNLNTESTNKRIFNLLGNGYKISLKELNSNPYSNKDSLKYSLIDLIEGTLRDVNFNNIKVAEFKAQYSGLIGYNSGLIENCNFENITVTDTGYNYVGVITQSPGNINNVRMNNIEVAGAGYVGGLLAYNSDEIYRLEKITNVVANNVTVTATTNYSGGIAGYVDYVLSGIDASNIHIKGTGYIGGIVGRGDVLNSSIKDSDIYSTTSYIGGVAGTQCFSLTKTGLSASNINISSGATSTVNYVGGLYGNLNYITNSTADNVIIANKQTVNDEDVYTNFNTNYVGGIVGNCTYVTTSKVSDSYITGNTIVGGIYGKGNYSNYSTLSNSYVSAISHVGGILGECGATNSTSTGNLVVNSNIIASSDSAGGIIGYTSTSPNLIDNMVLRSTITAPKNAGGIAGNLDNTTTASQTLQFKGDTVFGTTVNSNDASTTGGLIGIMQQVPASADIRFTYSIFNGTININNRECLTCGIIGNIVNKKTGTSSGYGSIANLNEFYEKANLKEYTKQTSTNDYQINSISALNSFINSYNTTSYTNVNQIDGVNYFPVFKNASYPVVPREYYLEIPYDADSNLIQKTSFAYLMPYNLTNYSISYNNKIDIDYDIYTSDVNKINIEFTNTNSDTYFYYKVGDYVSEYIPINERTYTITYDFINDFEIYLTNGTNYKTSKVKASDLRKTLSLVNGNTYYISNNILYSEDSAVTGNFVNLYESKALTKNGKIYDIPTKQESDAFIDYSVLETSKPLYTFKYNEQNINTYYNYSTVDSVVKDYQIFVKNGNLNLISTHSNKKDSYIIDFYNNNEIQIILNNDGILYSLKSDIKYPKNLLNKNITEMYYDIYSTQNIVTLKYDNGAVYTFNYRTGEEIFNNVSSKNTSILDYIISKVFDSSSDNKILSITSSEKYTEIELLKDKISDTSIEDAQSKLSDDNSSVSEKKNYITVYNDVTQNYDIYSVETVLNDLSTTESETNKIYKDYELVEFYSGVNKKTNKKSLKGIIMFTISIFAVLFALYILIRHKQKKEVNI